MRQSGDGPLVKKVTISVDDVGLRQLALDEGDDVREFMLSAVGAISDCIHG